MAPARVLVSSGKAVPACRGSGDGIGPRSHSRSTVAGRDRDGLRRAVAWPARSGDAQRQASPVASRNTRNYLIDFGHRAPRLLGAPSPAGNPDRPYDARDTSTPRRALPARGPRPEQTHVQPRPPRHLIAYRGVTRRYADDGLAVQADGQQGLFGRIAPAPDNHGDEDDHPSHAAISAPAYPRCERFLRFPPQQDAELSVARIRGPSRRPHRVAFKHSGAACATPSKYGCPSPWIRDSRTGIARHRSRYAPYPGAAR